MGWLRLVGSLKLYVSYAKGPYKIYYILQNRPIILRSPLIVVTPHQYTKRDYILQKISIILRSPLIVVTPYQYTDTLQKAKAKQRLAVRCNTLHCIATHRNTPQHTATNTSRLNDAWPRTVTHCTALQHITTHRNTPQHTTKHT